MFKIIGGVLGVILGSPFGFIGLILGGIVGSTFGRSIDQILFGSRRSSTDSQSAEEAYRKFYEQFTRDSHKRSYYSGYTNNSGNGYTGFHNPGVSDSCYANLGCSRTDGNDVIKRKYRKLVSQFHPDRISGQGLPQYEIDKAEAKFKIIQDSYDQIKKEKGI